ncbi:uncharacterized protein LOC120336490 [Styela clava]
MQRHVLSTTLVAAIVLLATVSAEIKLIRSTATTLEWNLAGSLKPGKKYTAEVLLNSGTGQVRVIDEPLGAKARTYKAFNLKSNKLYQLRLKVVARGATAQDGEISKPSYTNLRCYSCNGASSIDTCTDLVECSPNQRQCYTRLRYGSSTGRMYLFKGCKVSNDVCQTNKERMELMRIANEKVGDLSNEQVLATMPGLRFFGNLETLFKRSPAILKQVKKKYSTNKKKELEIALRKHCSSRDDPDDFCRCCCSAERCNHALLNCGVTPPPDEREDEPLPPDIATTKPEVTFPTVVPKKVAPICQRFNGGCDHTCIPLNKTTVRCECFKDYKLQEDGKTCKTHLKRAIADAGPDVEVTLPQDSVTLSGENTLGSVKRYRWWDPIASGEGASLTVSDPTQQDIFITNLRPGTYKFILMVTGMDGRRTSDMTILTVKPNPASVNATEEAAKKRLRPRRPRARVVGLNRYRSIRHRKRWKSYVKIHGTNATTSTTAPRLRFTTTRAPFNIIRGKNRLTPRRTTTTAAPATTRPKRAGGGKPGAGKRKPVKGARKPVKGTRKPGAGTSKTGVRKPGPGVKRPGAGQRQPASGNKGVRKPLGGGRKPTKQLPPRGQGAGRVARPRSAGIGARRRGLARLRMATPKPARTLAPTKRTPATQTPASKSPWKPKVPAKPKAPVKPKIPVKPKVPVKPKAPVKPKIPVKPKRPMRRVPVRRPGMANRKPGTFKRLTGPKSKNQPKRLGLKQRKPFVPKKPGAKPTTTPATTLPVTTTPATTETTTTTEEPENVCPSLDELETRHVVSKCSIDGKKCDFECPVDMTLRGGSESVTCGTFGGKPAWMNGPSPAVLPCCELSCPANAYADIVFLIHSTTLTGRAGWTNVLNFVNSIVSKFTFGKDNVCVGAVRYNNRIDTRSEIPLDCSTTKDNFKKALLRMPFVGVGANTGAGLNHLRTKSFKTPNNRPRAQDVAVLVSDSRSADDVIKPAKELKASGVKIQVIGIKTRGGTPNTAQLKTIASYPARILNLPRIPITPPPGVVNQMQNLVCPEGCQRYEDEQVERVALPKTAEG